MKNLTHRAARRRGFGLLESLICLSLMSLLFLGAMDLIMSATRGTVRTQALVYSTDEAANAIQNVIGTLHEASGFYLPTSSAAGVAEVGWAPLSNVALAQFSTTLPDTGETINTAIQITEPQHLDPGPNGYTQPVPFLSVASTTTGKYWEAGKDGSPLAYQFSAQRNGSLATSIVHLIYRGDPDGTPDAQAGTYLWEYKVPPDGTFDVVQNPPTALCKSVGTALNAVQFVRPSFSEENQVEIKIISSHYSAINGQQTNEQGSGASSSALSGKCVYMRDHYTGGSTSTVPTNTGSRRTNDAFQYH